MIKKRTSELQLLLIKTPQSSPLIFTFFFFLELCIKERPNCMGTVHETDEKRRGYFIEVISNDFETYLV